MNYSEFFEKTTGNEPYPYQERLGNEPWPDLLDIPTGLGKTAAVVVAWLWKRAKGDPETPRRLVYCLPMRTLVEQTYDVTREWIENAEPSFRSNGSPKPHLHKLLGGEVDNDWMRHPERDAILVGTQDMLLSRALMRGYGVSLFTWPMHFGFMHYDSLWVFDEVQLMGPGLTTSAQLEGFRRSLGRGSTRSRSLWCSATISKKWLGTVDFAPHLDQLESIATGKEDETLAAPRLNASKKVEKAATALEKTSRSGLETYAQEVADEVVSAHRPRTRTIVICNTVERAQAVYEALGDSVSTVLIHSRFRPQERKLAQERMLAESDDKGTIVVATQVIEAGVDVSSATLFTELCPWSSFVQRIGRCNRRGEFEESHIRWIDLDLSDSGNALPYELDILEKARERIASLESAAPAALPRFDDAAPLTPVLRKRDLLDLFSTDSDLSGFYTDISDYIRDADDRTIQVFWRDEGEGWSQQPQPDRDELCSTSLASFLEGYTKKRSSWIFDPIATDSSHGKAGKWRRAQSSDIRPGAILMLNAGEGGYSTELGFSPNLRKPVRVLSVDGSPPESIEDDRLARRNYWMMLADHLEHSRRHAAELAPDLGFAADLARVVEEAALWHDVGKLHHVFQGDLLSSLPEEDEKHSAVWAKGPWKRSGVSDEQEKIGVFRRRFFRHELPGSLAYLEQGSMQERELVAYLIAAHHGKVRTSLRAIPTEPEPEDRNIRYARGVWEGDELRGFRVDGRFTLEPMTLSLELMDLGGGESGRSWTAIVEDLLQRHGPFELALLEAVVRIADWRASGEAECWCANEGDIVRLRNA